MALEGANVAGLLSSEPSSTQRMSAWLPLQVLVAPSMESCPLERRSLVPSCYPSSDGGCREVMVFRSFGGQCKVKQWHPKLYSRFIGTRTNYPTFFLFLSSSTLGLSGGSVNLS